MIHDYGRRNLLINIFMTMDITLIKINCNHKFLVNLHGHRRQTIFNFYS